MPQQVKTINRRIAGYRKLAGYTQEQVADKLGMKRNTYARIEHHGNPSPEMIDKLSKLFGVPVQRFFSEEALDFSAPPTANTTLRANDTYLLDTSDITPLKIDEAYLLRILRALPQEYTDATIEFVNDLYKNRNKKKED